MTSGVPNLYVLHCCLCGKHIKDGQEKALVEYEKRPGTKGMQHAHKTCAIEHKEDE